MAIALRCHPRTPEKFATINSQSVLTASQDFEARLAEHLAEARRSFAQAAEDSPPPGRLSGRMRRMSRTSPQANRRRPQTSVSAISTLEPMLLAKQRVDTLFDELLAIRGDLVKVSPTDRQRTALRNYLSVMAALTDLSGRNRHLQFDAIRDAAGTVAEIPAERERLVLLLTRYRSTIGASVMVDLLFDLEGDPQEVAAVRASDALKSRVLSLIATSKQSDLLPDLADFVLDEPASPALIIQGAETIRELGLPQNPGPGQDPTLPPVALTADLLHEKLSSLDAKKLGAALQPRLNDLLSWLDQRRKHGVTEDVYQLGQGDFAPGDWLLMRNPSPYNLFTDISPGLFTHVGVIASEQGRDGIRRIVLVDLPERGSQMPLTNIDTFVKRTRHYLVLRHENPQIARKMGEAAASMVGNETQFDLNFRTARVMDLTGKPLKGQKIYTYCAGLLLLCALQTEHPREEFFPVSEYPAPGKTQENLKTFGMSIGEDFISPTGALFSGKFKIVARREPMYDPRREVEEAIYNHFAERMIHADIHPTADTFQALRLKVAEASKANPLLAEALASAANVSTDMDLVAAAKAAAVVETLDEVAVKNGAEFLLAQQAMLAGNLQQMQADDEKPLNTAQLQKFRQRHLDLYNRWTSRRVTPRAMRVELVNFYVAQGRGQLDKRFFGK